MPDRHPLTTPDRHVVSMPDRHPLTTPDRRVHPARPGTGRALHHLRANAGVVLWLLAALVTALGFGGTRQTPWLLLHMLLLGAVSNAILVWSDHFTDVVLRRTSRHGAARARAIRLLGLNAGAAAVIAGVQSRSGLTLLIGAGLVAAVICWHAGTLVLALRHAVPTRFRVVVRYYVAAASLLPVGIAAGVLLARGQRVGISPQRLVVAHVSINVFGWIALTVLGTLVTLLPAILHAKVAVGAEAAAARALAVLVAAIVAVTVAALFAPPPVTAVGLVGYLAGLWLAGRPLLVAVRARNSTTFAAQSVLAGGCWLVGTVVWFGALLVLSPGYQSVAAGLDDVVKALAVGFAAQVLLGALSYLAPMVLGGGPVPVRHANALMNTAGATRVLLVNAALVVWLLPVPAAVTLAAKAVLLAGLVTFLLLLAAVTRGWLRARRRDTPASGAAAGRRDGDVLIPGAERTSGATSKGEN